MLTRRFLDKEKGAPEGKGIDLDGTPVRRQRGMIYWYRWGRHTFDIRVMRRVLGLPEKHDADDYFMERSRYANDPDGALAAIVGELRSALEGRAFKAVMKLHDAAEGV